MLPTVLQGLKIVNYRFGGLSTNVIILKNKEELTRGKVYQLAVNDGCIKSHGRVLDGHLLLCLQLSYSTLD